MKAFTTRLGIVSSITLSCLATLTPAKAQIVPDNTLPVNSTVTPGCTVCTIDGGTVRGVNLFHSFSSFGVPTAGEAFFNNALQIENIFSRVTGTSVSNIDGLLRANGTANLFLLNPNGIIFGRGARLDIGGSFAASTANSVKFPDGSEFSATNPQAPPLLTINVTPGLQWGTSQPGATISNRGNLAPGQDLTLVADKLDLQGQLTAGRDLTLLAQDMVKVRDTAANPFIASAGGQLRVQGNQRVDIFALNHPESGLFSGGDMVLRSANTVGGDAHYWSGGSFRIEQLNGSLGNLSSPHDPIILASGDVSLGDYTGASLHILAGGSVTLGNVEINATDSAANTISPSNPDPFLASLASVQLSDGTNITIDGSARSTLDVRAGVDWTTFPGGTPGNSTIGAVTTPPTFAGATSADITVTGDIRVSQPGGVVLLTNQYRPNTFPGNISTQVIDTAWFGIGNGGSIAIDSRGNITTGFLNSAAEEGNGGAIALTANGNITTQTLDAFTSSGNGGDITLISRNGGINATGGLNAYTDFIIAGNGGNITLQAEGDITTRGMRSDGGRFGVSGDITITSETGTVLVNRGELDSPNYGIGEGGDINITAIAGSIFLKNGAQLNTDTEGQGNAGNVNINARDTVSFEGIVTVDSDGNPIRNGGARSTVEEGAKGNGGNINITAGSVSVTGGARILTRNDGGRGNAGSVTITARDTVELVGFEGNNGPIVGSDVGEGGIGNGNHVNITAGSVFIKDEAIVAASILDGRGLNGMPAQAGNVKITARDTISVSNNSVVFSEVGRSSVGNGGTINIDAPKVVLENGASLITQIRPGGQGSGGDINVKTESLSVTGGSQVFASTYGQGNAGNITIKASDSVSFDGVGSNRFGRNAFFINVDDIDSSAASSTVEKTAEGNGGNINITATAGALSVTNGAVLNVTSLGQGNAGNLYVTANSVLLDNGGQLIAETASGEGGNIKLRVPDQLRLRNNSLISAQATNNANGGNITIDTGILIALPPNGTNGSDIIASADRGRGGRIEIEAQGILGIRERKAIPDNRTNDIDASSEFGAPGTVAINTLLDPSRGLSQLPEEPVDSTRQISQQCVASGEDGSKFTITGRGGLPQSPTEFISPDMVQDDFGTPVVSNPPTGESVKPSPTSPPKQLVEAQGWVIDDNGVVTLVAAAPTVTPHSPVLVPASC
jgi:filamentous hemagglutinin family protein